MSHNTLFKVVATVIALSAGLAFTPVGAQQATHDTTHPAGAEAAEHQGAGGRARTRHGGTSSREPERQRAGVQLKDYAVVKVVRSWCTWA